jgi:hypothetical protein
MTEIVEHSEDYYEDMQQVVELWLKGVKSHKTISVRTGRSVKEVKRYIEEWQAVAKTTEYAKARAEEAAISLDKNYDMIVEEQWAIVNDGATDARTRAAVLKNIADVEKQRYDVVERAGWKDDGGLTDELVAAQERADRMKEILIVLARENPALKTRILSLLSGVEKEVVVIPEEIKEKEDSSTN